MGTNFTTLQALDLDSTAKLFFRIHEKACLAKNERDIILKPQEYDCVGTFFLDPVTGILSVAKQIDRELVQSFLIGVKVEDLNSDTGPQIASGE